MTDRLPTTPADEALQSVRNLRRLAQIPERRPVKMTGSSSPGGVPVSGSGAFISGRMAYVTPDAAALPAPSASLRGTFRHVRAGTGDPDEVYVCLKNSSDAYVWVLWVAAT